MKQNEQTGYPSLDNLEGKTVEELLALRQEIRQLRDRQRTATNDEITARQTELRREGINERRIFDIQLNELKRQLEEIGDRQGQPAWRIKATEVREKMSELKYKYNMAVLERDAQDARLAIERIRFPGINVNYWLEAIRDLNGFNEFGMPKKKHDDGEATD